MTRGPRPWRALDAAVVLAHLRGLVQIAERRPDYLYDFTISYSGCVAFVCVRPISRILALPGEIIAEFRHEIHDLRLIAAGDGISRELWIRSKHGSWRFFRVTDDGIVELDRNGNLMGEKNLPG
jgi:hypothetical protein